MRIPRSRGAVSGLLLIVLGAWGGLVPFVGPYFGLAIGTNDTWDWSTDRLWMSVLPGVVAVLGGLILVQSAHRGGASLGAWLGVAAGAWFVVGPTVSRLWTSDGGSAMGTPLGDTNRQVLEQLTMWEGLGVLIVAVAAFAMGRLAIRAARDVELNEPAVVPARPLGADERFRREPVAAPAARRPWASEDDEAVTTRQPLDPDAPTTRQPVAAAPAAAAAARPATDEARTTRQPAANDASRTREPVAAAPAPAAAARPGTDEARTTQQPAANDAPRTREPVAAAPAPAAAARPGTDEARTTQQPVAHSPAEVRATPRTPGEDTVATRQPAAVDPSPSTSTWNPPAPAPEPTTKRSGGLMGRLRGR
jgi:hypothetical protein